LIDSFEERADWLIYVPIKIVRRPIFESVNLAGNKLGGKVLRPARHPDWASCAFLGAREG